MGERKHREVVIEFERVQLIRSRAKTVVEHCYGCGEASDFLNLRKAATLFQIPEATLIEFVKANGCHYQTCEVGVTSVCLSSLLSLMRVVGTTKLKFLDDAKGKRIEPT